MFRAIKKIKLEKILPVIFGLAVAIQQFIYWLRALAVSRHATIWRGEPYWTSGGAGSFFPWPKEPGILTVMTEMSSIDQFIYYLIYWYLFPVVAIAIVLIFVLLGWLIGKYITKKMNRKSIHVSNDKRHKTCLLLMTLCRFTHPNPYELRIHRERCPKLSPTTF